MRTILIALLLCLVTLSHGQWNSQTSGVTTGFNDVHFEDANTGWVVGAGGIILKTINGGSSWSALTSGTANQINSVFFTSSTNGAVVGSGGLVSVTFDGGNTWFKQITGYTTDFRDIFYTDIMTAYIVGDAGKILKSTDGGLTWVSKPNGAAAADVFWSVWFTDSNTGWAIGGNLAASKSTILKTTDAGESWTSQTSPTSDWFYNISFGDGNNGWVAGPNGHIAKTTNGGANWTLQNSGTATEWLYAVYAVDSQLAFAGGGSGLILNTKDGGANWNVQPTGLPNAIRNFHFLNSSTGWAVGDGGTILKFSPASIQLNQPNGGENWKAGTSERITWTSNGIANVKIEYSTDNGANWNLVVGSTAASAGEYSWSVPNNPSTQTLVKISDAVNSSMYDQSNSVFTISTPSLILNSPNGGERWRVGTTQNITWISSDIAYVKIEYSIDDRATWKTLIASTPAVSGSYPWLIPDEPTLQAVIKISAVGDSSTRDDSNAPFHIEKASLTLNTPNGGQKWKANSVQNIFWNSLLVNKIKLEYSSDNGVNWNSIVDSVLASDGNYAWTTPNINSNLCLIRISDKDDSKQTDQSDSTFSIGQSSITLLSPNGGEKWKAGSNHDITWNSQFVSHVNINFSSDGGANWSVVVANISAVPGIYYGTVPMLNTNNALIRITDAANSSVSDQSDSTFTIYQPTLTLNSPNGGEVWKVGSSQNITWTSTDIGKVKIEYSTDNRATWKVISDSVAASPGLYAGTVPDEPTLQGFIKVSDASNHMISDDSNDPFQIVKPTITLTSPNGGQNWKAGTMQDINWTSSYIQKVKIAYSADNGLSWTPIVDSTDAASGVFHWTLPNISSNQVLVVVADKTDGKIADQSDTVFTIFQPSITVTTPNGGENWKVGTHQNILWNSSNVIDVNLEYSLNNGTTWNPITNNFPAAGGSYNWLIPNSISNQALIRITASGDHSVIDQSNSVFSIYDKTIGLLQPNGGEKWKVNSSQTISWAGTGIGNIKIDYSTNNGTSWNLIISNATSNPTGATNNLTWIVPNTPTSNARVRISDAADSTLKDVSNSEFEIFIPTLTLLTPNGGEKWKVGSEQDITWSSTNVANVKIQYSIDNGINWNLVTASTPADIGTFDWVIPDDRSSQAVIRISDAADSTVTDRSDAVFKITKPTINVLTPNGGEKIRATTFKLIEWEIRDIARVKINFSTDGGTSWSSIVNLITTTTEGKYNFNWQTPNLLSNDCLINVVDFDDPNISDRSNSTFSLYKSSLQVQSPNGGEVIKAGSKFIISWISSNVSKVSISYTKDGISTRTIASNIDANFGSYEWNVPNEETNTCKIEILDEDSPSLIDYSDAPFSIIKPSLTLVSPNGGEKWKDGNYQNIIWNSKNVNAIKIEYSTNNGTTWKLIATNVPSNPPSYAWLVPNDTTSQAIIRVTDISDEKVFDPSDNVFKIIKPSLTVTSPNGGENWKAGSTQMITWNSKNVNSVKLEYSVDNGIIWKQIASSLPASSAKYDWVVPDDRTKQVLVRISDEVDNTLTDMSDAVFNIYSGSIKVLYPNVIEILPAGKTTTITWASENVGFVKIEYYDSYLQQWKSITERVDGVLGRFDWLIPELLIIQNCKIKITSLDDPLLYDESDMVFRTTLLKVLTPNGGERWKYYEKITLEWYDQDNYVGDKLIEYSSNNGQTWNFISAVAAKPHFLGERRWTLDWRPTSEPSTEYKVRISKRNYENITDESNGTFEIIRKSILIAYPVGGERIFPKQNIDITFGVDQEIKKVNILFTSDNGGTWNEIVSNYDLGTRYSYTIIKYKWIAPKIYSNQFKIRVVDAENALNNDILENSFSISQRRAEFIYPTGSEIFSPGQKTFINFSEVNISNLIPVRIKTVSASAKINILYGTNCPTNEMKLGTGIAINNEFSFVLPISYCELGSFTITVWEENYEDEKDEVSFNVLSHPFQIISPQQSEVIPCEKPYSIKWNLIDSKVKKVKIELLTNNQVSIVIADEHPAESGAFIWQVPKELAGNIIHTLRISDASRPNYQREQYDIQFAFKKEIIIETPTEEDTLIAGSTVQIKWNSLNVSKLKIKFLNSEIALVNSNTLPNNSGSINWVVPDVFSGSYRLDFLAVEDSSVNNSKVVHIKNPKVTLDSVSRTLYWGREEQISWTAKHHDASVKIKYSVDAGVSWQTIGTDRSTPFRYDGGILWAVPKLITNQLIIKIENANYPSFTHKLENISITYPPLRFTSPNSGIRVTSGDVIELKWFALNTLINNNGLVLDYRIDESNTWLPLASLEDDVITKTWEVPSVSKERKYVFRIRYSNQIYNDVDNRDNFVEIIVSPRQKRIISSGEWSTPLNFTEGQIPVSIISDLVIGTRPGTSINSAIIKINIGLVADAIKKKFILTCTGSDDIDKIWDEGSLTLKLSRIGFNFNRDFFNKVMFQYTGEPYVLDNVSYGNLSLVLIDDDSSNVLTRPLTFTSVNSTPVIVDNSGSFLNYTIGEPPLKIVPSLSINDDINLRGKAILEVNIVENYIMGEDLIGAEPSPSITTSFLIENAKYKMTDNYAAPMAIQNNAKNGLYYLVENGTKSVGRTKKLEIQYFDDYQAASNKIIKNVTVKAPVAIAPNLKPPETVQIEHITGGNIRVSWTDRSGVAKGFIIYRTTNKVGKVSATYSLLDEDIIGIVPAKQHEFVDKTTAEGFTYSYRIASYNESGLSDLSTQPPIVVNSIIKPPTNLTYKLIAYNTIQLSWEDNSEVADGFVLEAKHDTSSTYKEVIKLNKNLTSFNVYNFIYNRNYSFRLKAFNSNTTSDESNVLEIKLQPTDAEELGFLPTEFALYQNYPNPFNPSTTINYHLPTASQVSIKVYDMLGREVAVLVNDYQNPGLYSIEMNSKYYNLGSGMYFYRIRAGVFSETKKMVLLK